jgi:cobalt-zinc-cadmium efflux system protein
LENRIDDKAYDHLNEFRSVEKKKLSLSLSITFIAMIVEFIGGYISNSVALISDAGHMFTHCFAIGISLAAIIIAVKRPPCHHRTFGLYRTEILAAFINGIFLLIVAGIIIYEAIEHIINPVEVSGVQMLVVAIIGLIVNLTSIYILHGSDKKDLNVKSVFYHMIADAASSVGVIIAAIIIYFTDWYIIDPIVSFGICVVIVFWAWGVLRDSSRILLQIAPKGLDTRMLGRDLKSQFPEIANVYHLHLWTVTADMIVFSAHIKPLASVSPDSYEELVSRINCYLSGKYNITESTVQIGSDETEKCNICPQKDECSH